MTEISENLKNLINADSRTFKMRLINGEDNYEQIVSFKKSVAFPSSSMSIGNALCACIECTVSNVPVSIASKKIRAEITIYESDEWIKFGTFTAEKPTGKNGNIVFTAYDAMNKASNYTYKSTLSVGNHTAQEYFEDICVALGEIYVPLDEISANFVIAEDKLSGYSCRDALAYLAGFLGKNCIVNREGLFEMVSFKSIAYDMLNIDRTAEPELSDSDCVMGYLACCVDSETTLMAGEGSKGCEFVSPLMTQERLNELYSQICGDDSPIRVYKAGKVTQLLGDPTVDICDVVSFVYNGYQYKIPITALVFDFDGGLQAEIESFDLTEPNSLSLSERLSFEQKSQKEKANAYINSVVEFSQAIQKAYGVSSTEINGITYFHDAEKIVDSGYIYCITNKGVAFTDSWGGSHEKTFWKYGLNSNGEAILNMLKVFHIKADSIETGKLTSVDGQTVFDLDGGFLETRVTENDDVKYLYQQNAEGVYLQTGNAISFKEFNSNLTEEEETKIEEFKQSTGWPEPLLSIAVLVFKYELWRKRDKGFHIDSSADSDDDSTVYSHHFSGNKSIYTRTNLTLGEYCETEYSAGGIKADSRLLIDCPGIDMPVIELTSEDDCDELFENGTYIYTADSLPKNAPYPYAAIIEVTGRVSGNSRKIMRVKRYGVSGYGKWRNLRGGVWGEWAEDWCGIEDSDNPGCYYRKQNNNVEWINPPMLPGVEYRTCDRLRGLVVFKRVNKDSGVIEYRLDGENTWSPKADKIGIMDEILSEIVTQNTGNSTDKVMSQDAVTKAIETLVTLPFGGSKEWLESNGDKAKLYQIGGYVWGYVESNGWTKSDTQFLVVSNTSQMTNVGGIPYLLRNGAEGTVYAYTEASGDAGVPVYGTLPATANEGDIVAVGGRKYKASLSTKQVPNWTKNYADTNDQYWMKDTRLNSTNTTACTGMTTTNYIDTNDGDVIRVANFDMDTKVSNQSPAVSTYNTLGGNTINRNPTRSHAVFVSEVDGVYTFNGVAGYIRFCGAPTKGEENIIITINEEITYRTEPIVTWNDIGAYTPPVEAGWNATNETYNVIDSLSATANSGSSAVYSVDGYVYSYISGADWMQMSKYNAPTISIDGELSDSSINAVQNKKVTEAINEVKAKANTNANEITAINERMAEIETGSNSVVIPSFWQSAVDEAITKIKALQVGKNCVTFPFFSDNHQRNGYAGILISHIMKECGIPYCFFGGDTISSGYLVESEMIEQDKAFDSIMSYIPEGRLCRAVGNHDGFWNDNGNKGYYTREKVYELFLRSEGIAQNKHFGEDGTYYYVDDIASKVRFVVLNTNSKVISAGNESIDDAQLSWLQNKALSFDESGWGVVIISHCPISNHYHANVSNAEAVINAVKAADADIIGWYSGHIHRDRMYTHLTENGAGSVEGDNYLPLGFTEVTITSDHTGIAYDDATKHTVANDALSHAIDFVTVNRDTRTVNITRLGIGEDRGYTY